MAFGLRRRGPSNFERAADGSMSLVEHIRELRTRLFRASLAVMAGLIVGFFLAQPAFELLKAPYCSLPNAIGPDGQCQDFILLSPADGFILKLKLALWIGLIIGAPVWLYQLWAFIAPGLHRNERKYTYAFTAVAVPLFAAGAFLAFFVVTKSLVFFLGMSSGDYEINVDLTGYFNFVTGVMLLFGLAFEFPLALLMLNFAGVLSAKRMLGWWRAAIFLMFVFSAVVTPTPDPFGMTALAVAMGVLYFAAVGVAFLNDRRRARNQPDYSGLSDDEMSPIEDDREPVAAPEPVPVPEPLDERYDEIVQRQRNRYDDTT